jgi:hypothetical protein
MSNCSDDDSTEIPREHSKCPLWCVNDHDHGGGDEGVHWGREYEIPVSFHPIPAEHRNGIAKSATVQLLQNPTDTIPRIRLSPNYSGQGFIMALFEARHLVGLLTELVHQADTSP